MSVRIRASLFCFVTLATLIWQAFTSSSALGQKQFDVVLKGGRIVDGTGAPWFTGDVGIKEGKITKIGRIDDKTATRSIDARGLVVAPGFIDMMGQTATPMMENPKTAMNLLTQGITTINAGEGQSAAPLGDDAARSAGWKTMAEYFQLLELKGLPVNTVQTVGHTQVRRIVIGEEDRRPSDEELTRMKELVREGMEAGAIGVSTALIYPPAVYARTKEIADLVAVAQEYGGGYYTHMRNEGDRLLEAIEEALDIGQTAKAPVHIFHLKAAGRHNWGKMQQAIARIKAARSAGHEVTADVYPYINNGLGIQAFIHPRHFAAGRNALIGKLDDKQYRAEIRNEIETTSGWENWFRHTGNDWSKVVIGQTGDARYKDHLGQTLQQMAEARGEDPWDTFFNLVRSGAFALPQSMTEANKIRAMREEFVSFCTDVGPAGGSRIASHPRAFGSFPRLLSYYVRELGALSLEQAVSKASARAANAVLVYDRGCITEGLAADIIVFDYQLVKDQATFAEPSKQSIGMKYVLVNGQVVLDDGKFTGRRPGRVLRGPGYKVQSASHAVSTGQTDERLASFDRMMEQFLKKHRVPGAALAVTDQGRLVHARGYGYADVAQKAPATPTSLFRIASISKPVTAVAILKLAEQKKLSLDDKVFDILDVKLHLEDGAKLDPRQREITLRHLLQHRGGWDRQVSFDAMFQSVRFAEALKRPAPAGTDEIIRCMRGLPLDFAPGERYAYSNYGYCLLGRVIEKVTKQDYEDYVRQKILSPVGIHSMRIGRTAADGRHADEVRYYDPRGGVSVFQNDLGKKTPSPYGSWHLEAMDSHGGWLASAVDLARFACTLGTAKNNELLNDESCQAMFARPSGLAGYDKSGHPKEVFYSLGWINRLRDTGEIDHWHTGSLDGTATILILRRDGRNFVALMNARVSPHQTHLGRAIDGLLHQAADQVEKWPEVDLFEQFATAEE